MRCTAEGTRADGGVCPLWVAMVRLCLPEGQDFPRHLGL